MLELRGVGFSVHDEAILDSLSFRVPTGHFMAIVGSSGCGKTTLLKLIAGILEETAGKILWHGRDLAEDGDLEPSELGYVPQFSIAYDSLTVEESIDYAIALRVAGLGSEEEDRLIEDVLTQTGMREIRDRRVSVLSGGQQRRLALAMELVSNPLILLCDEVTTGLDPRSERGVIELLHRLSRCQHRIVVNVTHSLSNMEMYDSILVLHEGCLAYHGPPGALNHYFSVREAEDIYPQLALRTSGDWRDSWEKHAVSYYKKLSTRTKSDDEDESSEEPPGAPIRRARLPGMVSQLFQLLSRRWSLLMRDRTQLLLHFAILIGFPLLVVLFTPHLFDGGDSSPGIPALPKQLTVSQIQTAPDPGAALAKQAEVIKDQVRIGGVLSGIIMFQVVLLTLMGSNNSSREIVGERRIFEKEKLAGLRPASYLLSKLVYLGVFVLAQALWMGVFVQYFAHLPGDLVPRLILLILVNAAMTAICLAISSWMRSTEQASLLSIYLVGFQLPLSGAVLALPDRLEPLVRPFISAYWSWAGQLSSLSDTPHWIGIKAATSETSLAPVNLCYYILAAHIVIGCVVAWMGCKRYFWN